MDKKSGSTKTADGPRREAPQPTREGNPDLFRTINADEWKKIRADFLAEEAQDQEGRQAEHLSFTDLPMEEVAEEIQRVRQSPGKGAPPPSFLQRPVSEDSLAAMGPGTEENSQDKLHHSDKHMDVGAQFRLQLRLSRLLADGMLGRVFLAEHEHFEMHYAVKVLHPWIARQTSAMASFLQAFTKLQRLHHPGIVRPFVLELDPSSNSAFYFMDYIPGQTLVSLLVDKNQNDAEPSFSKKAIFAFLSAMEEPLAYAHEQGVVAGNLQPSRILVANGDFQQPLHLLSFGLLPSTLRGDHSPLQSGPMHAMYYAAPETQQSGLPLTPAADVFSLGVIVYQMLTGSLPVGIARPPSEVASRWPKTLDRVMSRAMNGQWDERYSSVSEFVDDFKEAFQSKSYTVQLSLSGDSDSEIPASRFSNPSMTAPSRQTPSGRLAATIPQSATPTITPPHGFHRDSVNSPSGGSAGGASSRTHTPSSRSIASSSSPMTTWAAHEQPVTTIALSPDSKLLASAGEDRTLRIWSTHSWSQLHCTSLSSTRVMHLCWSNDSEKLAFVNDQNAVQVWDVSNMTQSHELKHPVRVHDIAWHPRGHQLYTALDNKSVQMWNLRMERSLASLTEHEGAVHALFFDRSLGVLVSGGADSQIKMWSVEGKRLYQNLCSCNSPVFAMALSHNGGLLSTGHTDGLVQLRDFRSGRLKFSLRGHTGPISVLAFGPNDRWLVSASLDASIRIWNPRQSKLLFSINHHTTPVHSICLNNEGTRMISASSDNSLAVWDTSSW